MKQLTEEQMRTISDHAESLARGVAGEFINDEVDAGLHALVENQLIVSSGVPGCLPPPGQKATKEMLNTYLLAMMVELSEFTQELNWKPWKDGGGPPDRIADEFADILAFMGVILIYLERMGINTTMLADAYRKKSIVNIQRFIDHQKQSEVA